jgi:AraC family transcriptional activator of pobA
MAKTAIQLLQLDSLSGIEIIPITDNLAPEYLHHVSAPHRHDHYCCFFITAGELNYAVDFEDGHISTCSLLISCPGQVHNFSSHSGIQGWGMAFRANLIDEGARSLFEQSLAEFVVINLNEPEKEWFSQIFQLMYTTVNDKNPLSFYMQLMQSLLSSFFYKAAALFKAHEDNRVGQHSLRSTSLVDEFNQLLKTHFITWKKPADYALEMNVSVSYLNDTIKSVTGFSTTYLIHQEIFREAQRQLFYTGNSVKEIAYALGYEDYKYFIRLFGKTVGSSPSNFRKQNKGQ